MPNLDYFYVLIYFLIGTLSGVSMGIIGVGAGMVTIPLLIYTGLNIKQAVGISLIMQLLPQSLPGVMMYYKNRYIDTYLITIAMIVVLGSLFGIFTGSYLVNYDYVNLRMMYIALTVLLFGSGLYILNTYILNSTTSKR